MSGSAAFERLGAIVLAAGFSRRMGAENKLLKPLSGRPLLTHALTQIQALQLAQTLVVVGHDADAVAQLVPSTATVVRNEQALEGKGRSIASAAAAIDPALAGVFIVPGDMPFIEHGDYELLASALSGGGDGTICVPIYEGRRGNPVLFGREHFPLLRSLAGDTGARPLVQQLGLRIRDVEGCSSGVVVDLDDAAAFLLAEQRLRNSASEA